MPLSAGDKLGPYEILAPLGAGGMGEVYKARDTRLARSVAIKVLPAHVREQPEARARFEREARAVSALNHPHVCNLFDVGEQGGVSYIVMEHLEGETLETCLRRGPLPLSDTIRLAVQIAEALGQAHAHGIVHRDLKPANIMITRAGAKLLDFGLAKIQEVAQWQSDATVSTAYKEVTTAGTILGTFQYMSPEALEGKEADARSDIFALGAMLYEMVTGVKAFKSASQAGLITTIMSYHPPPPSSLQPQISPALDRIVLHCLPKNPDERWQSARDLADELRWITQGGSQTGAPATTSATRRKSRRSVLAASVAGWVLFAAALVPAFRYWRAPVLKPLPFRFRVSPPANTTFPASTVPAISPDGNRILFSASRSDGRPQLWVRHLDAPDAEPLPGTEDGFAPFWSPDGRKIGFSANAKLLTLDLSGGAPVEIYNAAGASAGRGAWNTNGEILFVFRNTLWRVFASGRDPRQITALAPGEFGHSWPEFLPGGSRFIYQSVRANGSFIVAGALGSKEQKDILQADGNAHFIQPGYLLFARGGRLMAQSFDPVALALKKEAFPIPGVGSVAALPAWGSAFGAGYGGLLVWRPAAGAGARQLVWLDRKGGKLSTVGEAADFTNPGISPDGRRLAVCLRDAATKTRDIWIFDLSRGTTSRFTFDPADDLNPVWSPDGSRIAFTSDRKGDRGIYVKNADGSGQDELLFAGNGQANVEAWSSDGRFLVFNLQARPNPAQLWALPLSDRRAVAVTDAPFAAQFGQVSPDGRWLAYGSNETGQTEVYVIPFAPGSPGAGKWQISTAGGQQPYWRADGRELFFANSGKLLAVDVNTNAKSFEAGTPHQLFEVTDIAEGRNTFVASPDGKRFLVVLPLNDVSKTPFDVLVNWTSLISR